MAVTERYAGFVVDLDGVVFRGTEVVRGAAQFVKRARRGDLPLVFVTNNSTRTPGEWATAFDKHRMKVEASQILTSATATARMLAADRPPRCFVVGEFGLASALRNAGIDVVDHQAEADTVVVGWDRRLTFEKLRAATAAIARGARFVGTNPDVLVPGPDGEEWPGNGATLAYLRTATGVAPEVVGKPMTPLLELAAEQLDVDGPILVVGDQVATDITAAQRMGFDSALVLSGVSRWTSLVGASATPTWVVPTIGDLDGPEPPVIRHAREADLSAIRDVLDGCDLDSRGAARRLRSTLVAEAPGGDVVGTASWEMVDQAAHLRGIAVATAERGHGTGSHLIVRALHELQASGVEWVYLLTPGAEELLQGLGFWPVHRDRVPADVLATAQFGAPASGATALVRRLGAQAATAAS